MTTWPDRLPFDVRLFEERAARFETLDVTKLTPDELYNELMWVVATTATRRGEDYRAEIPMVTRLLPTGTLLWRARGLPTDDHVLPLRSMNSAADAWEPPDHFVTASGRLNKPREPLLYTCVAEPHAAPLEIRVRDGVRFSLMKFRVAREVSLTAIGLPMPPNVPEPLKDESARLISDFFARQFSKPASDPAGHEYYLAELVAKYNYDLPPEFHDGWLYPSTQMAGALNATLRPEPAHAKLELMGVAICSSDSSASRLQGWCFSDGQESPRGLTWSPMASEVQTRLFPEFA